MTRFLGLAVGSVLALVLALGIAAATATAGTLPLPASAEVIKEGIAALCPDCITQGVTACGTADVMFGRRFARNFLAGKPARGYLPEFVMNGREFRELARSLPLKELTEALIARFNQASLVIVEDGFGAVRVIEAPDAVVVSFPEPLHQCLRDAAKAWGCCIAADCADECCEKDLGSPVVTVRWTDREAGESILFSFGHAIGSSTLTRSTAARQRLYWCLTDEAGFLK